MKTKNRFLAVLLALVVVMLTSAMTAFAEEDSASSKVDKNIEELLVFDEITGISASSIGSLFSENQLSRADGPKLSNVTLTEENGKFVLQGILTNDGKVIDFVSSGDLYKKEKTDNAHTYGNLILGDLSHFKNIHFVQFRIDKDKSSIFIILQTIDTKELMQFELPIDQSIFDALYNSLENKLIGRELEEKIIELYSVGGNLIDADAAVSEAGSISPPVSTNEIEPLATTYNGWDRLINDLNANGSVILSNYRNIDASVFKGSGWKHDRQWGSTPYAFVSYSTANGPGEYFTQFALVDVITHSLPGGGNDLWNTSIEARYKDGMIVKYDAYSDRLTVEYYGWGLSFNNFAVGTNGLTDQAVFIKRSVSRSYETSGSIVRAALAIYSPADTIVSVFEHLSPYENQNQHDIISYDPTYNLQFIRHNGRVIRGIAASSESNYLSRTGHQVYVGGEIRYNPNTGSSWMNGYSYIAYSNLR